MDSVGVKNRSTRSLLSWSRSVSDKEEDQTSGKEGSVLKLLVVDLCQGGDTCSKTSKGRAGNFYRDTDRWSVSGLCSLNDSPPMGVEDSTRKVVLQWQDFDLNKNVSRDHPMIQNL